METLLILGILGVGAFLLVRPASAATLPPLGTPGNPLTPGPGQGVSAPPLSVTAGTGAGPGTQGDVVSGIVSQGATIATKAATSSGGGAASAAGGVAGAGASAATIAITAGIGAAVTIFAVLWSKHLQRLKQAKDENAAMNLGVQGFDEGIRAINADYNAHKIDAQTAIAALKQLMQQYWLEIFPHIQPGRNGCGVTAQGAANCPSPSGDFTNYCAGNVGAGCCVGCEALNRSLYYDGSIRPASGAVNADWYTIPGAIVALQRGGGQSRVFKVYGSKYGGNERPDYFLTWGQTA